MNTNAAAADYHAALAQLELARENHDAALAARRANDSGERVAVAQDRLRAAERRCTAAASLFALRNAGSAAWRPR